MSLISCELCGELFDTDFEMETDGHGNCICDRCAEQFREKSFDEQIEASQPDWYKRIKKGD